MTSTATYARRTDRQAVTRGAAEGWAGRGREGQPGKDFFEGTMAGCRPVRVRRRSLVGEGLSDWTVGQPDEGSERAYLLTVNGTAAHLNNTRG